MIDLDMACKAAYEYFKNELQIDGLAAVTEDGAHWFFSGGVPGKPMIGNIILSVYKADGSIETVDYLSDDGYELIHNSSIVELPSIFAGKEDHNL